VPVASCQLSVASYQLPVASTPVADGPDLQDRDVIPNGREAAVRNLLFNCQLATGNRQLF
jgi:hypothetical protein